ncbi:sensor histidine kinase [Cohnella herbarum]|uniref:Histidine kinase n=1 Tax=Cohnella herbarum TaxID=2728023 RepID=A0A7Z2ZJ77_9BACL|nr:histidine kinase [Cohnella herbarum]QJD81906.1 histidine kinase [Cohnella herbarum]
MELSSNGWQRTLFPKLIFAFMLVIVPMYGIGLMMNQWGESSVRRELNQSLESRVGFYMNALTMEQDHIADMLLEMVVDQDLQHFAFIGTYMSHSEWSSAVRHIENRLEWIRNSSEYVADASAHIVTIGRTLSSSHSISDGLTESYEAVSGVHRIGLLGAGFALVPWRDRLFLGLSFPADLMPDKPPSFVLSVELDKQVVSKRLDIFAGYGQSGAILLDAEGRWSVASKGTSSSDEFADFLRTVKERDEPSGVAPLRLPDGEYLAAFEYSTSLDSYLIAYVKRSEVFGQIAASRWMFWLMSLLSLVFIVAYSYWIYRLIHRPLQKLIRSFRKAEDGMIEPAALPRSTDEFRYLFQHFNRMVERIHHLIRQVYEQKIRAQSAELKQLQSQINPHFLYNTYFVLYRLAKMNDLGGVIRFSQHLGEYFQYITYNSSDRVPLETEVKHSWAYGEIQNIRFSDKIVVEFGKLPESWRTIPVPRLLLQPIIENAYKHGMEDRRRDGCIRVGFEMRAGAYAIVVEDNGEGLTDDNLRLISAELAGQASPDGMEHAGLLNVQRRLQIMYGPGSGLFLSRSELGGLRVEMAIDRQACGEEVAEPDQDER